MFFKPTISPSAKDMWLVDVLNINILHLDRAKFDLNDERKEKISDVIELCLVYKHCFNTWISEYQRYRNNTGEWFEKGEFETLVKQCTSKSCSILPRAVGLHTELRQFSLSSHVTLEYMSESSLSIFTLSQQMNTIQYNITRLDTIIAKLQFILDNNAEPTEPSQCAYSN